MIALKLPVALVALPAIVLSAGCSNSNTCPSCKPCPDAASAADVNLAEAATDAPATDAPIDAPITDAPIIDAPITDAADAASGDSAGPACDDTTFVTRCEENGLLVYCNEGHEATRDCADGPNPVCVALTNDAHCLLSADDSKSLCGTLPECVNNQGKPFALRCTNNGGKWENLYVGCTFACGPDTGGEGQCVPGSPCTGDESYCKSSTEVTTCDGKYLTTTDCSAFGLVCVNSTLGNGVSACHAPGQSACDPATFIDQCTTAGERLVCSELVGLTSTAVCLPDEECCMDNTGKVAGCCSKP